MLARTLPPGRDRAYWCRGTLGGATNVDRRTADLNRSPGRSSPGVSLRTIAAVVIALLVLLFIVLNRDPTRISFVAKAPLWVALAVAAAGGFVAGFLLSRRRYK